MLELSLVYSSRDNWWFWRHNDKTSQPFYDLEAAVRAFKNGQLDWQE